MSAVTHDDDVLSHQRREMKALERRRAELVPDADDCGSELSELVSCERAIAAHRRAIYAITKGP